MKRTLDFWLEQLKKAQDNTYALSMGLHCSCSEYKNWIKPFKLKKQFGHALNRDYTGYKIHIRRRLSLKKRYINLTKAAKCRKEIARLRDTKIPFYKEKIAALGGKVKEGNYDY